MAANTILLRKSALFWVMAPGGADNPSAAKAGRGRTPTTHTRASSRAVMRLNSLFFKFFSLLNDARRTVSAVRRFDMVDVDLVYCGYLVKMA